MKKLILITFALFALPVQAMAQETSKDETEYLRTNDLRIFSLSSARQGNDRINFVSFSPIDPLCNPIWDAMEREMVYFSDWEHFRFYTQHWNRDWSEITDNLFREETGFRHLLIFDTRNDELIDERFFWGSGEYAWLESLNRQRIGYLFQNKPPVIFQFDNIAGWCTYFIFLEPTMDDFHVMCDNRW